MKSQLFRIKRSTCNQKFIYGNCCSMAISQAAKVNEIILFRDSDYNFNEGCTTEQCTELIQKYLGKKIVYKPNTKRIKLRTFVEKFNKNK